MAAILGDEKERQFNAAEAARVQKSFLKKWWNPDSGGMCYA